MDIKYPDITVEYTNADGNAFALLRLVRRALLDHGVEASEVSAFLFEATAYGYDNLLVTCARWVDVR